MLPIRLFAMLCCIVALVPAPSAAQPVQNQPNNAVQTPGAAANATGGYEYVPPNAQPAHSSPQQSTSASTAPPSNYCAPPSKLVQQRNTGALMCFDPQNICPNGQIPLAATGNGMFCCPVVGGGANLAQGASPNLCCPANTEAGPNGTCVGFSGSPYNGTPAVPATVATCPQGSVGAGPSNNPGLGCYMTPGCPPGFSDVGGVCSSLFGNQTTPAPTTTPLPGVHVVICSAGEEHAANGACCQTGQLSSSGVCCPKDRLPQPNGSCGYNPALQMPGSPTQQTKREETRNTAVAPNGNPAAVAVPVQPEPTCSGGAQLVSVAANDINPLTGQQVAGAVDVCITPAAACPTGTSAAGITFSKSPTFYCCAGGFHSYFGNGMCCPADQNGVISHQCGVPPTPAVTASCPAGSVATYWRGMETVCMKAASCASGYTVSGTSCCPPGMATPSGVCCPAGQPPEANGLCRPNRAAETPNVVTAAPESTPPSVTQACPSGLVPREAFAGDRVCVTRAEHDQVIADNLAGPTRSKPDGTCVRGYVWREARPSDHVCVLPEIRTQTRRDNAQAGCLGGACVQQPPSCLPPSVLRDGACVAAATPARPAVITVQTPALRPGRRHWWRTHFGDVERRSVQRPASHAPQARGGRRR